MKKIFISNFFVLLLLTVGILACDKPDERPMQNKNPFSFECERKSCHNAGNVEFHMWPIFEPLLFEQIYWKIFVKKSTDFGRHSLDLFPFSHFSEKYGCLKNEPNFDSIFSWIYSNRIEKGCHKNAFFIKHQSLPVLLILLYWKEILQTLGMYNTQKCVLQ